MFAIEAYDVEPDIMTLAKGIASGFPLGAFIAREDVADAFEPGDHMSTFGGNPVSCAAGVATIDMLIEEHLPERAARVGAMATGPSRCICRGVASWSGRSEAAG